MKERGPKKDPDIHTTPLRKQVEDLKALADHDANTQNAIRELMGRLGYNRITLKGIEIAEGATFGLARLIGREMEKSSDEQEQE